MTFDQNEINENLYFSSKRLRQITTHDRANEVVKEISKIQSLIENFSIEPPLAYNISQLKIQIKFCFYPLQLFMSLE